MNTMAKAARRTEALTKHYTRLEQLATHCGVTAPNGKTLSLALWTLEREAHQAAEDYCNGQDQYGRVFTGEQWETLSDRIEVDVNDLFNNRLMGLFVNGDPRGHALKIESKQTQVYRDAGIVLEQDWGGDGLLSPTIE